MATDAQPSLLLLFLGCLHPSQKSPRCKSPSEPQFNQQNLSWKTSRCKAQETLLVLLKRIIHALFSFLFGSSAFRRHSRRTARKNPRAERQRRAQPKKIQRPDGLGRDARSLQTVRKTHQPPPILYMREGRQGKKRNGKLTLALQRQFSSPPFHGPAWTRAVSLQWGFSLEKTHSQVNTPSPPSYLFKNSNWASLSVGIRIQG